MLEGFTDLSVEIENIFLSNLFFWEIKLIEFVLNIYLIL